MARLVAQASLEDIRQRSDIVTVIGAYFPVRRQGGTFKALCPFHKEKTPSFVVNPQKQIFHCFGCGVGGDVFRFVMEYEKVDFMTAVKMLAQRAGVRLSLEEGAGNDGQRTEKEALLEIHAQVAQLYRDCLLKSAEAERARAYLRARDLPPPAVEQFGIGFAPDRWDMVLNWGQKKYTREQLEAAGLVIRAQTEEGRDTGRWYDRFRNRLMFPIQDEQGRIVGFSGRLLEADPKAAKYVNSPETALFRKGRLLYALSHARRAMVEAREAIVCEGQIDVIRCHLAGWTTAVAAQGTAFTEEHARTIKRYADSVILAFDGDTAGRKAALKAADVFVQVGLAVRIAALPAGEDPDSLLRRTDGVEAFRRLLAGGRSALDFLVDVVSANEDVRGEAGAMRATAAVLDLIRRTPNAVQQARMLQQAAARLGVAEEALRREFHKLPALTRQTGEDAPPPRAAAPEDRPIKEWALAEHLVADPALTEIVRAHLPLELITDALCRRLVAAALDASSSGRDLMALIAERDDEQRELGRVAAGLLAAPPKVKGVQLTTNEEAVKSLILAVYTAAFQRRRQELERRLYAAPAVSGPPPDAAAADALRREHCQLGYDIVALKRWETAVPVMELHRAMAAR